MLDDFDTRERTETSMMRSKAVGEYEQSPVIQVSVLATTGIKSRHRLHPPHRRYLVAYSSTFLNQSYNRS